MLHDEHLIWPSLQTSGSAPQQWGKRARTARLTLQDQTLEKNVEQILQHDAINYIRGEKIT